MTPEVIAALVNMGSAGAVILVVLIFLRSNEKRDAQWRDFFTALNSASQADLFKLDTNAAAGLVVILASYIIGVAVDPGDNAGTWYGVVSSRKFLAAAIGLLVMILDGFNIKLPAPFSPDTLIELAALIGAYIGGVAIEGARQAALIVQSGTVYNPEARLKELG